MNPYLLKKREQYNALQSTIDGIQTRAAEESRELTAEELRSIKDQVEASKAIYAEIELLTDQENRSAAVADLGANLRGGDKPAPKAGFGNTVTPRDPGHYRSVTEGGDQSFFGDLLRAKVEGNAASQLRLSEHNDFMRVNQTTATVPGVVPPVWMVDQYTTMSQQQRAIANTVRNVPILDARPFSLPGQTATTVVATQASENTALTAGDAYAATPVTVTPTTIVGKEIVSRQLLDASNPVIDGLILSDLTRSYNAQTEVNLGTALRAVGSAATATLANFILSTNANFAYDLAINAQIAVRKALLENPSAIFVDYDMYGVLLKLKDTAGRPLVVNASVNPTNVDGVGTATNDGWFAGLPLVVSQGMDPGAHYWASVAAAQYVLLFESPGMSFRYEEVGGPQSIQLGLWKYQAIAIRQGTRAVSNIDVT